MAACASRSMVVSTIDLLAVQWYWTAGGMDIANVSEIDPGGVWGVECTGGVAAASNCIFVMTAIDVIHSVYLPTVLLRTDVAPGRMSAQQAVIDLEGSITGQCSELCGALHGFMAYLMFYCGNKT